MKFSIQEEDKDKQIFFTFKEAQEKTGLPSKTIYRVLKSGKIKYFRRADKTSFFIQEEDENPFIQIDGEDFFTAEEIQERFGLSRTVFFNQLCKKKSHFLDSLEKSHEVTWVSPDLEQLLWLMKKNEMGQKILQKQCQHRQKSHAREIRSGLNASIENFQNKF